MTTEFWEGCCELPEMYPQHMKIRQEPTSLDDFHTIPIHFIPNSYKPSPMKAFQWLFKSCVFFFILQILFTFSTGWGKNQTRVYASIRPEGSFGSLLGWYYTALVERNLCVYVQSPEAQHWLPKEPSTVPSFALWSMYLMVTFHSLTEKFQLWGIECRWRESLGFENFSDINKDGTEDLQLPWEVIKAITGRTIAL